MDSNTLTFISIVSTFTLGISAKPIHDWANNFLNSKKILIEKKRNVIKQTFLLTQKLKKIPEMVNQAISSAILLKPQ